MLAGVAPISGRGTFVAATAGATTNATTAVTTTVPRPAAILQTSALASSADHRAGRGEGETGDQRHRAGDGFNRPTVFDDIGDEPRSDGEDNDTDGHGQPAASPIAEARLQQRSPQA